MQREEGQTTGETAAYGAPSQGAPAHGSRARVHLSLPGTPDSLPQIREAVVGCATRMGFDDEEIAKIEMAVGEACSNVIEHAYTTQPLRLEIDVMVACFQDRIEVTIIDYSTVNFPVDEEEGLPLDQYLGEYRRRGLGLYIIRNFVDSVEHRFIGGRGNELRLVKFLT